MYQVSYLNWDGARVERVFSNMVDAVRFFRDAVWDAMDCVCLMCLEERYE